MSDEDWCRLADAEISHDRATAEIEVAHLQGKPWGESQ
jgi:hypothetical protein